MVTANFRMMEHTVPPVTLSVGSRFENIELVQYVCDYLLWPRQVSPETAHGSIRISKDCHMWWRNSAAPRNRKPVRW